MSWFARWTTKPLNPSAIDEQEGVAYQNIWDETTASYGSFTHT